MVALIMFLNITCLWLMAGWSLTTDTILMILLLAVALQLLDNRRSRGE